MLSSFQPMHVQVGRCSAKGLSEVAQQLSTAAAVNKISVWPQVCLLSVLRVLSVCCLCQHHHHHQVVTSKVVSEHTQTTYNNSANNFTRQMFPSTYWGILDCVGSTRAKLMNMFYYCCIYWCGGDWRASQYTDTHCCCSASERC